MLAARKGCFSVVAELFSSSFILRRALKAEYSVCIAPLEDKTGLESIEIHAPLDILAGSAPGSGRSASIV
jgi:hypothetical protein